MNYKKIGQELLSKGYLDDRWLMCHSNANATSSSNYGVFMKFTSTRQESLPSFMILSIHEDKLHISKAKMMGGFKEYFGYIELAKMTYVSTSKINMATDSHKFNVLGDNGIISEFYINATQKKDECQKLINAIRKHNK